MCPRRLFLKLNSLSPDLKKEVLDYIDFLSQKMKSKKSPKKRKFGAAKGMFIMHSDFDAPIPDFQDYS